VGIHHRGKGRSSVGTEKREKPRLDDGKSWRSCLGESNPVRRRKLRGRGKLL